MHDRRQQQMRDADELLFSGPEKVGFAKGLFLGRFVADAVLPYPRLRADESQEVEAAVADVRDFMETHHDAAATDRQADVPRTTVDGLARLGVLGMAAPREYGGRGFSQ